MRVLAREHEGAQIALTQARLARLGVDHVNVAEVDDLLRDEAARLRLDAVGQLGALGGGEARAEHHAVAAGLRHVFDDELAHAREHLFAVLFEQRHVGGRVVQDGRLAEVVLDHLRHEVVHGLVVGHAVAGRVDDGHVARAVRPEDARHADHRIGIEREGIEELVGKAAVHHADAVAASRVVAQVHLVLHHFEILGEGELGARLLGEVGVLEKRRVVAAGREHHGDALARDEVHRLAQQARVIAVVTDVHVAEQARIGAALDVAHEQRVARARRDAQVVLEHPPAAILALHEIFASDVREHAAGRRHAIDLGQIARRGVDVLLGNHPVGDDALIGVDVAQVGVERVHALLEAALELVVLLGRDDARDGIVGEQAVVVFAVVVDAEAHAVARKLAVDRFPTVNEVCRQLASGRLDCHDCS